jgi:hypothetical protein
MVKTTTDLSLSFDYIMQFKVYFSLYGWFRFLKIWTIFSFLH